MTARLAAQWTVRIAGLIALLLGILLWIGGVDLVTLATWAGHQNFRTTARYLHVPTISLSNAANVVSMKTGGGGPVGEPE